MAGGTPQIGADLATARNIALAPAGGTFDTDGRRLTLSGAISGPGDLHKTGSGTLTLSGANTYAGTTHANAGRLEINGFAVRTDAAGNSDKLVLSGAAARATLNGGTVDVRAENGDYRRETRYHIVSAAGGVNGQFSNVSSNLAFLNPSRVTNRLLAPVRRARKVRRLAPMRGLPKVPGMSMALRVTRATAPTPRFW